VVRSRAITVKTSVEQGCSSVIHHYYLPPKPSCTQLSQALYFASIEVVVVLLVHLTLKRFWYLNPFGSGIFFFRQSVIK
jgi:hypothetical protein